MKKKEVVSYTSKKGKRSNYKVKARFKAKEEGKRNRVLLQSYGENPVEFWVDEDKVQEPMPFKSGNWDDDDY